jgi:hypothetical protein
VISARSKSLFHDQTHIRRYIKLRLHTTTSVNVACDKKKLGYKTNDDDIWMVVKDLGRNAISVSPFERTG